MDNTEINGYQNEIMFAKNLNGKKIKISLSKSTRFGN